MEQLVELLARVLIAKGVDYAIAYVVAREQASALGNAGGSCSGGCDPLARCRMLSDVSTDDECYAWDLPNLRR